MRTLIALLLATPVHAWEFTATPICTLSDGAGVTVTYDHATQLYAIALTRAGGWPDAPAFSIRFGGTGLTISTRRHAATGDTLTVTDSGFGNVLSGIAGGGTATAFTGSAQMAFSVDGSVDAVEAFRACTAAPVA